MKQDNLLIARGRAVLQNRAIGLAALVVIVALGQIERGPPVMRSPIDRQEASQARSDHGSDSRFDVTSPRD